MAVTLTITQQSRNTYLAEWTNGVAGTTYYVYRDGELIDTTTATSKVFVVAAGESAEIEVYDDGTAPAVGYPSRIRLEWDAVAGTDHYLVYLLVISDWTPIGYVLSGSLSHYSFETPILDDCTSHQFRVIAVDTNNIESNPHQFTCLMVRRPTNPDVTYSYDAETGYVTIA